MEFLSHPQSNPIFESTYTVFVTLIVALVALTSFQLKSESIRRYAKDMYSFGRNQLFKVCMCISVSMIYLLISNSSCAFLSKIDHIN